MTAQCDQCRGPLFKCDELTKNTVCVECVRKSLDTAHRLKDRGQAITSAAHPAEWQVFIAAVRRVAAEHDGQVDWTHVRPLIRGRVEPKHVGQLVKRARRSGLLIEVSHHRSEDHVGKNAGRLEPLYRIGEAA